MKLVENKEYIIDDRVLYGIYWLPRDMRNSSANIWYKQGIWVERLITSDYLIASIDNEINRE